MASTAAVMPFDQIVLHLDVAPDLTADAEIVGQALVAWVAAARAASEILDPYSELRVGLIAVEPGSVRLRAIFDFIENKVVGPPADFLTPYPRIKFLAKQLVVATAIGIPAGLAIVVGEHVLYPDPPAEIHREFDVEKEKVEKSPVVQKKVERFYRTVEKDPAITSVSVREGRTMLPLVEINKAEFPERSGLWSLQTPDAPTRPQAAIWDVVVTHAALLSKPKPWRFLRDGLPFSAVMADDNFLRAIAQGTLPLHIQEGVEMRIKVEWTERLEGQAWEPVNRTRRITRVISPQPSAAPAPLLR